MRTGVLRRERGPNPVNYTVDIIRRRDVDVTWTERRQDVDAIWTGVHLRERVLIL